VANQADAVWVRLPWRRRDQEPEKKNIVVTCAATDKRVRNVIAVNVNREFGDLVFQARTPGEYHVYHLPQKKTGPSDFMKTYFSSTVYDPPEETAEAAWRERCSLTPAGLAAEKRKDLPQAEVLEIQAIDEFHRFDPMEVIATASEMEALLAEHADRPYLLFPEDRRYPIRMPDELPQRWIEAGPSEVFHGEACRGEFYAFQIGVYAARQGLEAIELGYADLRAAGGATIPAANFRCINLGGTDWLGRPFRKELSVPKGRVQPLWIGVQIPPEAEPGEYEAALTLRVRNAPATEVMVRLSVTEETLDDAGDGETWRHGRLRWLDSTIGLDDEAVEPYDPIEVEDRTVDVLGRDLRFGNTGLPGSIRSRFSRNVDRADGPPEELLAAPVRFVVQTAGGPVVWSGGRPEVVRQTTGAVEWEAASTGGGWSLHVRARMECDGHVNYRLTLTAERAAVVKDLALEVPLRRETATYMMGMGCPGGYRPAEWRWRWDSHHGNNHLWIGDVHGGLNCKLKHVEEDWVLGNFERAGLYRDWSNGGRGGCTVTEEGDDTVLIRAYTGERSVEAGETLHFNFALLVTPVKKLDKNHWRWRYAHHVAARSVEENAPTGATIINVHQGDPLNPYINYPFLTADQLKAYADAAHEKGMKVKFYYTVRELTNYTAELWALRSLGDEVFLDGPGFANPEELAKVAGPYRNHTGDAWLCEHLLGHYLAAWQQPLEGGRYDAAIATVGLSRWHNYYLEGLRWLLVSTGLDGLYLDDIGYDREIMKRVRKVMRRTRPGSLIDFHSGNGGPISPACQYLEHFPYIDSLWFGEGFNYEKASPDYWLVEISGIPFGLFGEMLQDGGNPWRGMIYGMTNRLHWQGDPRAIWKVWDDFGIQDARMIGYWDPACPVKTDREDVLATVYRREGRTLIALASWAKDPISCKLRIDWQALGLDAEKARLFAPAVPDFQDETTFRPSDEIPVAPARGWLIIVDEGPREGRAGG